MTMSPNTLLDLANTGASLRVSADKLTTGQLNQLAAAVGSAGGTLTITNADKLAPEVAKGLLAVGGKQICFEVI